MDIQDNSQRKPSNRSIIAPIAVLALSLLLLAINTVVLRQQSTGYQEIYRVSTTLENRLQKLANHIDGPADRLIETKEEIGLNILFLSKEDVFPIFIDQPSSIQPLQKQWKATNTKIETILGKTAISGPFGQNVLQISMLAKEIQTTSVDIAKQLLNSGGSARQVSIAEQQLWLTERILKTTTELANHDYRSLETLISDLEILNANFSIMNSGNSDLRVRAFGSPAIQGKLASLSDTYKKLEKISTQLNQLSSEISSIAETRLAIIDAQEQMLKQTASAIALIDEQQSTSFISPLLSYLFAFLSLVSIAWIGLAVYRETQHQLAHTAVENKQNQDAIMTLLDELENLADGDLTTYVTVTEDFTGAIADSINYTIDRLRILVSSINETSVRVSGSAEKTQNTAALLAKASLTQAKEISGATSAVNEMVSSIEQVSRNASESTTTAEQFLRIANTGADVVDNTLRGMDTIREQIQDTSKRIKRLSESSQEIGDIVSLIDDIADQTNILALNAAIQASMAGDAGRGFAVVADEVQRLAERSSAATKQIEALVKTIQSDTNEAGISMEKTTTEVVNGSRLAKDAASALGDIEKVSNSLATLIDNISGEAQQQLSSVEGIALTMNTIQEITTQTLDGSQATSKSIGNLTSISAELRESVASFRLPPAAATSSNNSKPAQ